MKIINQIRATTNTFSHRVVPDGTPLTEDNPSGVWVGYSAPACYYTTKGVFIGVTDFYKNSAEFPNPEKLYWVREAPASI